MAGLNEGQADGARAACLTAGELADAVGGRVEGDASVIITGISSLMGAGPGEVSFVSERRYARAAAESQATCLILPEQMEIPSGCKAAAVIRVPLPSAEGADSLQTALGHATNLFALPEPPRYQGVHPAAVVGRDVVLGEDVSVGAHAVIEDRARVGSHTTVGPQVFLGYETVIGENCRLSPGVKVGHRCQVGSRVVVHGGVVIGGDGFGFILRDGQHKKVQQIGNVVIKDDVEIGSNTTIDRARFGSTLIGRGTKIDDLVMIAHNCQIGEHCIITGQCGLAGSAVLGDYVVLGAKAGLAGHVKMGDRSVAAGRSGVSKDVPAEAAVMGMPAEPARLARRRAAALRKLPDLIRTVRRMCGKLDELCEAAGIETVTEDN